MLRLLLSAAAIAICALGAGRAQESSAPSTDAGTGPLVPTVDLPEGRVARAWASVGEGVRAAELAPLPAAGEARWSAWAKALLEERDAATPDGSRRALLARIAREQGRDRDGWAHLAACLDDPGRMFALMPAWLPGAPSRAAGDNPFVFPDGVKLSPALPPDEAFHPDARREMVIDGFAVGNAILRMSVSVDRDGVQVEIAHLEGETARMLVVLPEPDEASIRVTYVDWFRQDEVGVPIPIEIGPGEEEPRTLFGRFGRQNAAWSRELPQQLPAGVQRDGLRLEVEADAISQRTQLDGLATALAQLLDVPVGVGPAESGSEAEDFAGIRVRLEPSTWRGELRAVVSGAERFALAAGSVR